VSGDGKVVFGVLTGWNENIAVRWLDTGGFEHLPPQDGVGSNPSDANFDGSIIVGDQRGNAVLWDTTGSMHALATMLARIGVLFPPDPDYGSMPSYATGICNDGTVLIGNFQDVAHGNTPIPWAIHLKGTGLLGLW
jgi:uncharacterized membrane protein